MRDNTLVSASIPQGGDLIGTQREIHTLIWQSNWCEIHTLILWSDWCEQHATRFFRKKITRKPYPRIKWAQFADSNDKMLSYIRKKIFPKFL